MKNTLVFLSLIMLILLSSCNKEDKDYNYTYTSEELNLTEVIQQNYSNIEKSDLMNFSSKETIIVQSILNTDLQIPENLSQTELEKFLAKNIHKLSGNLKFTFNGIAELEFDIENGMMEDLSSINSNQTLSKKTNFGKTSKGDCSFEGIRVSAQEGIYAKSTVSKIICAFTFYACYGEEVLTAIENNCLR